MGSLFLHATFSSVIGTAGFWILSRGTVLESLFLECGTIETGALSSGHMFLRVLVMFLPIFRVSRDSAGDCGTIANQILVSDPEAQKELPALLGVAAEIKT